MPGVDEIVDTALEGHTARLAAAEVDRLREPPLVHLLPTMTKQPVKPARGAISPELEALIAEPPVLEGKATEETDGREIPVMLALVHDPTGATRGGIELHLADGDGVLHDRTRTSPDGLAVLRLPRGVRAGELRLADGSHVTSVSVPGSVQHTVVDLSLESLPDLPDDVDPGSLFGDDPFERLPSDFTPDLAGVLSRLLGTTPDPILGRHAEAGDFRGRRTPLIKRMTVPRLGATPVEVAAADRPTQPKRYLVRLRQEWRFLGYTLGELSGVDALDPGTVLNQVTATVERVRRTASESLDEVTRLLDTVTRNVLTQASSIDSVISVATQTNTSVTASGFGSLGVGGSVGGGIAGGVLGAVLGPVGGLVGGLFGGASGSVGVGGEIGTRTGTSVLASTTTSNRTATSLHANSLLQTATSQLNRAVRQATSTLDDVTRQARRTVDQVSPLLSRVTNLLRWTLYENYAVTSHVEDVLEIRAVPLVAQVKKDEPVFTDEDIVEYRRYFEPALLEPRLAGHFDTLARAIGERLAGGRAISVVHLAIDYAASVFGADLEVSIGGSSPVRVRLAADGATARCSLRVGGVLPDALGDLDLRLVARPPSPVNLPGWVGDVVGEAYRQFLASGEVRVTRVRVWFESAPTTAPHQIETLSDTLRVTNDARTTAASFDLKPPTLTTDTTTDPLFRHVNRNVTYYLGVLAEAALRVPALRDDAPELAAFGGDHPLWQLPIVGFEGNRVLVILDPGDDDEEAQDLLADEGAATILQLAAPGAYAEALQGLLELTDLVEGKIHPALLPAPAPTVPTVGVVDLAGLLGANGVPPAPPDV
ncbi:MAG: hypothetical protein M3N57_10720 [Actinomycetota bacterium]|nr:hypothetical protein [Actinomycetota bacterium]